jgi:mRNA interferase RelE/StbE
MDKISKALQKLTEKERIRIKSVLEKLNSDNPSSLDIKRLKGHEDIFRVRSGDIRIIYRKDKQDKICVLAIARRNEKTYKL